MSEKLCTAIGDVAKPLNFVPDVREALKRAANWHRAVFLLSIGKYWTYIRGNSMTFACGKIHKTREIFS